MSPVKIKQKIKEEILLKLEEKPFLGFLQEVAHYAYKYNWKQKTIMALFFDMEDANIITIDNNTIKLIK